MSLNLKVKNTAVEVLNNLSSSCCVGIDDYCDNDAYHPMADALLLESIYHLWEARIITEQKYKSLGNSIVKRLDEDLATYDGKGWGLGFDWKNRNDKEVYIITTSLVIRALSKYYQYSDAFLKKYKSTLIFMCSNEIFKLRRGMVFFPSYSPSINKNLTNASCVLASSLLDIYENNENFNSFNNRVSKKKLYKILNLIYVDKKKKYGWGYEYKKENEIYDLLHQAYILKGLINKTNVTMTDTILVLDSYRGHHGYIDKATEYRDAQKVLSNTINSSFTIDAVDNSYFLRKISNARTWSIGAILAAISLQLMCRNHSQHNSASYVVLKSRAQHLASCMIKHYQSLSEDDQNKPRNISHVLYGLSSYMNFIKNEL